MEVNHEIDPSVLVRESREVIEGLDVEVVAFAVVANQKCHRWNLLSSLCTYIIAGSMLDFFSIWQGSCEPCQKLFVGQLSPIKLDLNFFTVHGDVTFDPEGDGVFDPGLGCPPFGQLPLEVLAFVVGGVSGQQALSSNQLSRLAQLGTVLARQLNPNLGEPAPLGTRTVELEVTAQLSETQRDDIQATAEHEAQSVLVSGTAGAVGNFHFGHGHGS